MQTPGLEMSIIDVGEEMEKKMPYLFNLCIASWNQEALTLIQLVF